MSAASSAPESPAEPQLVALSTEMAEFFDELRGKGGPFSMVKIPCEYSRCRPNCHKQCDVALRNPFCHITPCANCCFNGVDVRSREDHGKDLSYACVMCGMGLCHNCAVEKLRPDDVHLDCTACEDWLSPHGLDPHVYRSNSKYFSCWADNVCTRCLKESITVYDIFADRRYCEPDDGFTKLKKDLKDIHEGDFDTSLEKEF